MFILIVSCPAPWPVWLLPGVFPSAGFPLSAFSGVRGFSWEDVSGRRDGKVHRGRVHFFSRASTDKKINATSVYAAC
ncbi:hypothetical protein AVD48_28330 [Salmonella enterica subsp. enterica serovar Java]|nr:hypothetical protein [Salmonella enterica]EBU8977195.1 hypothetical protein [Salmonella enterica subsp. enterica serovar Java]EBI4218930.1 hypothetical protein [Salmonella enterica]EBI4326535.1 hypothetical protein [Salmonella enterica]EBV8499537.1 hypothetical protein [Salmonella enterica subsp. enterica serovar Java]